ncbi:MAG: sigma-70 family RNA polymerase sigma factor [Anaerolineae bacterium]
MTQCNGRPPQAMEKQSTTGARGVREQYHQALADLYDAQAPRLYRYFWFHTRDEREAEDLLADAFCEAIRCLHTFEGPRGNLGSWVYAIARRVLSRYYRTKSEIEGAPEVGAAGGERAPSSAKAGLSTDTRIDLWEALSELSRPEQEVIALKFGAGLRFKEIGEAMGLRTSHVGYLLYRALRRLRARLTDEEGYYER